MNAVEYAKDAKNLFGLKLTIVSIANILASIAVKSDQALANAGTYFVIRR